MQDLAVLVLVGALIVSVVVGGRLIWVASRTRALPEFLFGIAFLGTGVGQGLAELGQRTLWTAPSPLATVLNTALFGFAVCGTYALFAVIWRVFHPGEAIGGLVFLACCLITALAYGLRIYSGDFITGDVHSRGMQLYASMRMTVFCWAAVEAFSYYRRLRKRIALGLADSLSASQILLWGIAAVSCMGFTFTVGRNQWTLQRDPLDDPFSTFLLVVFVTVASAATWCAFFPPASLRRHLQTQ